MVDPSGVLPAEFVDAIEKAYDGFIRTKTFQPGVDIIIQGNTDEPLYVILAGTVSIIKRSRIGKEEHQISIGGRGAVIGEIRALNPQLSRTRTVRAETVVKAICLYREDVVSWNATKGRPWTQIHEFLTSLAAFRISKLSGEDLMLANSNWGDFTSETKPQETPSSPQRKPRGEGPLSDRAKRVSEIQGRQGSKKA